MRKYKRRKISINVFLIYGLFICISFISLGYSSLNVTFNIEGSAVFRVDENVRLTNAVLSSSENGGYENFNVKYSKDELISNLTLTNGGTKLIHLKKKSGQINKKTTFRARLMSSQRHLLLGVIVLINF